VLKSSCRSRRALKGDASYHKKEVTVVVVVGLVYKVIWIMMREEGKENKMRKSRRAVLSTPRNVVWLLCPESFPSSIDDSGTATTSPHLTSLNQVPSLPFLAQS
jgi:hypothetical protein